MGKFRVSKDLEEAIARMCLGEVQNIVDEVEREAKRQAPATKKWVTRRDAYVRNTHRAVHDTEVPENLRFKLTAFEYDLQHPGHMPNSVLVGRGGHDMRQAKTVPGSYSWMDRPGDRAPGHFVQIVACRCVLSMDPDGVAKMVSQSRARLQGKTITGVVFAEGEHVIPAEYGDAYGPGIPPAPPTWFMHNTVTAIGARAVTP